MKLHRHLVEQTLNALHDTFVGGYPADKVLERILKAQRKWGARDRKFVAESVYEIVRHWRRLWAEAGLDPKKYLDRDDISDHDLWRVWACFELSRSGELPDWDEVEGLRFGELADASWPRAVRESIPDWIDEIGFADYGKDWDAILSALNRPADVFLRVNTLKSDAATVIRRLAEDGIEAMLLKDSKITVRLSVRKNVFITKAFREGLFEVQDAASQTVAPMTEAKPGERVIDACAGAGGKTLHLGALMGNKGRLLAMDIHEKKLIDLRERVSRNGIDIVETRVIESSKTIKRLEANADAVLLDVPCSGLGVLRRNPDSKWKLLPEDIDRLTILQGDILGSYSRMVKPGGRLVYATCSLLKRENGEQVQAFLEKNGEHWKLEVEKNHRPDLEGFDGFYAARLRRL